MKESSNSGELLSLPPSVVGNCYGQLTVAVDRVVWHRTTSAPTDPVFTTHWWGSPPFQTALLRPVGAACVTALLQVKTDAKCLKKYLDKCQSLMIWVLGRGGREISCWISAAEINRLMPQDDTTSGQLSGFYPICDRMGGRVGGARITLSVSFSKATGARAPPNTLRPLSPANTPISQALERGERLRQTMVLSLLKDGKAGLESEEQDDEELSDLDEYYLNISDEEISFTRPQSPERKESLEAKERDRMLCTEGTPTGMPVNITTPRSNFTAEFSNEEKVELN